MSAVLTNSTSSTTLPVSIITVAIFISLPATMHGRAILGSILVCLSLVSSTPSQRCLDCICQASSGCKTNIRCHNTGAGQYFCGPYQISWAYWADGGKPGNTGFANDFEKCLVDKTCAETAIKGYMAKWASDCNRDGRIDCLDYAAIHKAGPTGCQQSWLLNSKYWSQFNQCYREVGASLSSSSSYNYRPVSAASDNIIEIPKPAIRTTNLAISSSGDVTPAISSGGRGSSSGETIAYPSPGGMVFHSYSSSSSSSRSNYSRREFEEETISSASGGATQPREGVSDDAFIRPARLQNAPSPSVSFASASNYRAPSPGGRVVNILEEVVRHESPTTRITSVTYNEPGPSVVSSPRNPRPAETAPTTQIVPSDCMACLCHASSKCQLSKGCDGAYCGPFLLSWGYWADGGQPGGGVLDYPTCARNRSCAEQAVHGYMNKWQRDCNQDGRVDCIDFALIHKLGPHGCGRLAALESTDYWRQFTECRPTSADVVSEEISVDERNPSERSVPSASNRVSEARPDGSSVRIAFNNREVVNIGPEDSNSRYTAPSSNPSPSIDVPQPSINSNIISRTPYINRPAAIVSARPLVPQPEAPNSLPSVESVPDQLAPSLPEVDPVTIEEEPVSKPKPQSSAGLTEVILPPTTNPIEPRTNSSSVSKECLECICHASSRCSASIGCVSNGRGKYNCGPYQVDWEYWTEAGKPGNRPDLSNLENFQMCLNNRECADMTVRAFLQRNAKDCNDDGLVDCNDFAALHVAGPKSCNAQWYTESKYYSDFRECFDF